MLLRRVLSLVAVLVLLSACSGHVEVPTVSIAPQANLKVLQGKYAAMIQTGGWKLETKSVGRVCSAWTFTTETDTAYFNAMRDTMLHSLGSIDFLDEALTPEDVKKRGYSAQIVVYQGNAESTFNVNPGFFTASAVGNMSLNTNIAVTDKAGLVNQYAVTSTGSGFYDGIIGCERVGEAIALTGQDAVKNLSQNAVMYIRDGLRDLDDKKASEKR